MLALLVMVDDDWNANCFVVNPSNFCNSQSSQSIGEVVMMRVQMLKIPKLESCFGVEREKSSSFMSTDSTAFYADVTELVSISTHDPNKTERIYACW